MPEKSSYDALVVGSGPNGLAAAIRMQQQGLSTLVIERNAVPGGATRTEELTLPGFHHDTGSAIHPLGYASPFLRNLPLEGHGLSWVFPDIPFGHARANGQASLCYRNIEQTAESLGPDGPVWRRLFDKMVRQWDKLENDLLGPLTWPDHPIALTDFGLKAIQPAASFNRRTFKEEPARTLFMGAAAHAIMPLTWWGTASFGLVLTLLAHRTGWPFPQGGAGSITAAMASYFTSLGGELFCDTEVRDLADLPEARAILLDMTPRQILELENHQLSSGFIHQLENYKYGAGICKVDWALSEPVPFTHQELRKAGTVHFGDTPKEIIQAEAGVYSGHPSDRPYVLFAQHSVFDPSRAPENKHTAWAYCHVPLGSDLDATEDIEAQIERAAPGFRDCIIGRSVMRTTDMERWNPNLVLGDINGGRQDLTQLFTRPVRKLTPYRTSRKDLYICSSSTPPGGGVHGMCGYHAAGVALRDHFN